MLSSIVSLINNFLRIENSEIPDKNFDKMKNLIEIFEKQKNKYTKTIGEGIFTLSLEEKGFLKLLFANIEFLLRRFGKIIAMYHVIFQKYTMKSY